MSSATDRPLVSVVIPAYNSALYITRTVESALTQTYTPLEVVIVDDGSSDNTVEVIANAFGHDHRVRCIRQANAGPSAARNRAIYEARGEFVHFLDADDFLLPTKIEKSYALFCQQPEIAVVYGHGIPVMADGVTIIPQEQPPLPSGWVFCDWLIGRMSGGTYGVTPTFMVRRDALLTVGGFNETQRAAEDWDLWLRLASRYPFAALDEPLVYYRRLTSGLHTQRLTMARGRLQTYLAARNYHGRADCIDDDAYDRLLAGRWYLVAVRHWEVGQRREAQHAFREALKLEPRLSRYLAYGLSYIVPLRWFNALTQFGSRR